MNIRFLSILTAVALVGVTGIASVGAETQRDMGNETEIGLSGECWSADGKTGGGGHIGVNTDGSYNTFDEVDNPDTADPATSVVEGEALSIVGGLAWFGQEQAQDGGGTGSACENPDCVPDRESGIVTCNYQGHRGAHEPCGGTDEPPCPHRADRLEVHAVGNRVCYSGSPFVWLHIDAIDGDATETREHNSNCYIGYYGAYDVKAETN